MIRLLLSERRAQVMFASLLATLSALASILLLANLNHLAGHDAADSPAIGRSLGLLALMFASSVVSQCYLARYSAATIARLRRSLSERFIAMDYERMQALGGGVVSASLITDLGILVTLFLVLPLFFFNVVSLLLCLGYVALLSLPLFGLVAGMLGAGYGMSRFTMGRFYANYRVVRAEEDGLYGYFHAISQGKKELSLNAARSRHFLEQVIQPSIERVQERAVVAQSWWSFTGTLFTTLNFGAMLAVIAVGAAVLQLAPAVVLQAFAILLFAVQPMSFLVVAWRDIAMGFAAAQRLQKVGLDQIPVAAETAETGDDWHELGTDGLQHRYAGSDRHGFAFGPVDLAIRRGEIVFVVGGNGSGKSTFALLLAGLLRPTAGHVTMDGRIVGDADLARHRRRFAAVFFDFCLFRHAIDRDGIVAADARVNAMLARLDLADKVRCENGVLSTLELSQGQRKRLALLQAELSDGEIFVFDEWAADQDPEFKRYFYREFLPALKRRGKTVIAITHDDRYFDAADRLIRLEQGRVAGPSRPITEPEPG